MSGCAPVETINVYEAKTQLSRLLARVEAGEEVIIARAGTPVARLVRFTPAVAVRRPGTARGQIHMSDDFDAPLPPGLAEALGA